MKYVIIVICTSCAEKKIKLITTKANMRTVIYIFMVTFKIIFTTGFPQCVNKKFMNIYTKQNIYL